MQVVNDKAFWFTCAISNRISEQLDRLLWCFQTCAKPTKDTEQFANLSIFVFRRARELREEISILLDPATWTPLLESWEERHVGQRGEILTGTLKLVAKVIGDFDRRIIQRIEADPFRLLWYASVPADQPSDMRKKLSQTLLDSDPEALHTTARKFVERFRKQLRECAASDGRIAMSVYAVMRLVSQLWTGDTQEIEGIMNMIKYNLKKGAHTQHEMLDARVGNRKSFLLATHCANNKNKWTDIEAGFTKILESAVENFHGHVVVRGRPDRFMPPLPCLRDIDTTQVWQCFTRGLPQSNAKQSKVKQSKAKPRNTKQRTAIWFWYCLDCVWIAV